MTDSETGEESDTVGQVGKSLGTAAEAALLAGSAAAAPTVAVAGAVIDKAKDAVDVAKDVAKGVGDALDDIFGGDDDHTGESTFPVDPDAPTYTPEEYAAQRQAAIDAQQEAAEAAQRRWSVEEAKAGQVQNADQSSSGIATDPRHEPVSDDDPHSPADNSLDLEPGLVGQGASSVIDVNALPTAEHDPAKVPFGDDVALNPQPIPPGRAHRTEEGQ